MSLPPRGIADVNLQDDGWENTFLASTRTDKLGKIYFNLGSANNTSDAALVINGEVRENSSVLSFVAKSALRLSGGLTPSQITANQNDYNPASLAAASVLRLNSNASRNITSLAGGTDVVAAEQRGAKTKKKLEIDPLHADTVRLIYRLALEGDGTTGQIGVKNIVSYLNSRRIFTRDGGRWGIGQVHRILTRRTYMGEHEFNKRSKTKELKPVSEIVTVPVPPIIDRETFDAVQALLKARHPKVTPSAVISGPTLLTGLIHCAKCGGARQRIRREGGGYRRDHLRALAQRVEVADGEVRIMGSKTRLLQALIGKSSVNSVPTQGLKWRRERDSNPRYGFPHTHFPGVRLQPLGHPSQIRLSSASSPKFAAGRRASSANARQYSRRRRERNPAVDFSGATLGPPPAVKTLANYGLVSIESGKGRKLQLKVPRDRGALKLPLLECPSHHQARSRLGDRAGAGQR